MTAEQQEQWNKYMDASRKIDARVEEAVTGSGQQHVWVDYSAYGTDDEDVPLDNLDAVAIPGKCIVYHEATEFYGGRKSQDYVSEVLDSPTWLRLCVEANRMIGVTRDKHHVFLEGVDEEDWDDIPLSVQQLMQERGNYALGGTKFYRLIMGS